MQRCGQLGLERLVGGETTMAMEQSTGGAPTTAVYGYGATAGEGGPHGTWRPRSTRGKAPLGPGKGATARPWHAARRPAMAVSGVRALAHARRASRAARMASEGASGAARHLPIMSGEARMGVGRGGGADLA
jgi:hypothetical protein